MQSALLYEVGLHRGSVELRIDTEDDGTPSQETASQEGLLLASPKDWIWVKFVTCV